LGATPQAVLGMILHQGAWLVLAGVSVGLLGAAAVTRVLVRFLFSVPFADPLIFFAAAILLALVALAACYIPARRAMRVEPTVALRHE
jgi:putative ABC transport system permease protein